jgi:ribose/xylose/arabinose/galactoside ABC-type transport system permease subunit
VRRFLVDNGTLVGLVGLVVYFSLRAHNFLTVSNLLNVGNFAAGFGIVAAGFTIALCAGQVDLSIGPLVATSGIVAGLLLEHVHTSLAVAVLGALGVALGFGLVNGVLVVDLGVYSFIATLAVFSFLQGFGPWVGSNVFLNSPASKELVSFAQAKVGRVPVPLLVLLGVYAACYVLLSHTRFGWHVQATGGNPSAALRAGIRVNLVYRAVFLIDAALVALAACILVGRASYVSTDPFIGTGSDLTLSTVAAVLISGLDFSGGGGGRIERTLVGVAFIAVLQNGLTLQGQNSYVQIAATGIAFLLGVTVSSVARRVRSR